VESTGQNGRVLALVRFIQPSTNSNVCCCNNRSKWPRPFFLLKYAERVLLGDAEPCATYDAPLASRQDRSDGWSQLILAASMAPPSSIPGPAPTPASTTYCSYLVDECLKEGRNRSICPGALRWDIVIRAPRRRRPVGRRATTARLCFLPHDAPGVVVGPPPPKPQ
jgi:hypothetical protein